MGERASGSDDTVVPSGKPGAAPRALLRRSWFALAMVTGLFGSAGL